MAIKELLTGRNESFSGGRIYFTRIYTSPKADLTLGAGGWIASGAPVRGDALGLGTWANKVEPRCFSVQTDPRLTRGRARTVVRYSAPITQGVYSGTIIELDDSQQHSVSNKGEWSGYRRYACTDATALANRATLQTTAWTINSISYYPHDVQVAKDPACPGISILTCVFRPPDNPWSYRAGKATIEIRNDPIVERLLRDLDDKVISGLDKVDPLQYWKLATGANVKRTPRKWIIIKMGFAPADLAWGTWDGWTDKLNNAALSLSTYPTIAIHTLKFHNYEVPAYEFLDPSSQVVPVRFIFEHRPGGFPTTTAQKYVRTAQKQYATDPTDDPAGTRVYVKPDGTTTANSAEAKFRLVWRERAVGAAEARRIDTADNADFSTLYGEMEW